MKSHNIRWVFCAGLLVVSMVGCSRPSAEREKPREETQREREEKTREEAARATEHIKDESKVAAKKVGEAVRTAAEEAHAAAQGVKEGWQRGGHSEIDLNSATESELLDLPGITSRDARRIIDGRPYHNKGELVTKGILSEDRYDKMRDYTTIH